MRLFLSSYRAGNHEKELLELLGKIKKVGFISNAKDYKSTDERDKSVAESLAYYRSIGLEPTEIDLRPYFHKQGADNLIEKYDFVFLAGGNAFLLRRALKYSSVDEYLMKRVKENSLVYGGESAGAILAAPTLRGSEDEETPDHEDDPHYITNGYENEIVWEGLGLIDYVVVPHYKASGVAESIDDYVNYLVQHKIPHKTIGEEQVIIINGDKMELLK